MQYTPCRRGTPDKTRLKPSLPSSFENRAPLILSVDCTQRPSSSRLLLTDARDEGCIDEALREEHSLLLNRPRARYKRPPQVRHVRLAARVAHSGRLFPTQTLRCGKEDLSGQTGVFEKYQTKRSSSSEHPLYFSIKEEQLVKSPPFL